jgi:tetratricopeptide (TPR) repeat protein
MIHERCYRLWCAVAVLVFFFMTSSQWTQVIAGSPEDRAYQAIARETDAKKRLELLDAFLKNFSRTTDLAQIYEFYCLSYRELGDADKEIEYAEKSLAFRQDSQLMLMLGRALAVQGKDLRKAMQTIKDAAALAARVKDNPPMGITAKDWAQTQNGVVATAKQLLDYALDRYKQTFISKLAAESDPNKVIALLDEYQQVVDDPASKPLLYDQYIRSYMRLENRAKVLEYADKALALNPDNVEVLGLATNAYLGKPMDLDGALAQAQRAVVIADALDARLKPAGLDDESWTRQKTQWKALAYATRGLVNLQRESTLEAAVSDLEKARDFAPNDGLVEYRLGIAYWKSKRIDDAIKALAQSAIVPSGIQKDATLLLETYYKAAHNGSTEGLKELIEKAKEPSEKPIGL